MAESIGLGWGTGVLVAGAVAAVLWAFGARWVPGWRHRAAAAGFTLALVGTVAWIAYSIATCRTCS